jgi:hypothetical protein
LPIAGASLPDRSGGNAAAERLTVALGSIGFSGGFSLSAFNRRTTELGIGVFGVLPNAAAAKGLSAAAKAATAAQRSRQAKPVDLNNMEGKARAARQRADNFDRLQPKLDDVTRRVEKARDKLVDLKETLTAMRKQIVLAQDTTIDDTQRRLHANEFDRLLGNLNIKVRVAGSVGMNLIGSKIRDIFNPDTLTYKTRPDSPVSQTVTGVYSGSEYFITDGNGDTFYADIYGSILTKFPAVEGDEGELVSVDDSIVYDPDTGAISLTRNGEGTPYLSGTLTRKGLGVLHSAFYENFTDPARLDDALADLDAASSTLRFNISKIEATLGKVSAQRDFNERLVEEHRSLANKIDTTATLDSTQAILASQREQLLFAATFETTLTFNGGGGLVALAVSNLLDISA